MTTLSTTMEYFDKLLGEQLLEVEGGGSGGETWNTVFEGNVTTTDQDGFFSGEISGLTSLTADTIKVTFNGTEYELPRNQDGYGAIGEQGPDFSEYPLFIVTAETPYVLYTETAGTYTLKIEEEQTNEDLSPHFTLTLQDDETFSYSDDAPEHPLAEINQAVQEDKYYFVNIVVDGETMLANAYYANSGNTPYNAKYVILKGMFVETNGVTGKYTITSM